MAEVRYRTGTAARMLGVSSYHVRRLCEAELILAEFTGHEWLIPASEIDRLMKDGIPDIPAADPNAGQIGNTVKQGSQRNRVDSEQGSDPYRAAGRAPAVIEAYAEAHKRKAAVEAGELDLRQAEIALRKMELQAKIDERLDQANDRKRKAADEARRADWLREAEEEGLAYFDQETSGVGGPIKGRLFGVEEDWIDRIRLQLQQAIRDRLTPMDPIPSVRVTASLLVDVTSKFINKAREEKEGYVIIIGALENELPFDARAKAWEEQPSEWQRKLQATINARLEGDHPLDMIRRVVNQAVADVTREFEEQKENRRAAEEDQESRQSVKAEITRSLRGRLSRDDWADMEEAIDCQFAVLSRGTRRTQLEAACRKAVAPWSQLLEQVDKEQRQRDEQDRRRRMREEVIWNTSILKFPFGFPEAKQKAALADVRQALEAANPGDRTVAEQIRDQALQPHLDAHQQQKQTEAAAQEKQRQADGRRSAAERRIDSLLLDAIENAIAAEERDGLELDGPLDRVNFKFEVRDAIRPGLVNRFWTITNLQEVSDKVINAAIEHAARKHILKAVPEG